MGIYSIRLLSSFRIRESRCDDVKCYITLTTTHGGIDLDICIYISNIAIIVLSNIRRIADF